LLVFRPFGHFGDFALNAPDHRPVADGLDGDHDDREPDVDDEPSLMLAPAGPEVGSRRAYLVNSNRGLAGTL
jgi:hypothetical protein